VSEHAGGTPPMPEEAALPAAAEPEAPAPRWSPWRAVLGFGLVSLATDAVYGQPPDRRVGHREEV
jgi:hypothetical protein